MDDRNDSEQLFKLMRQHFVDDPEENLETLRECSTLMSQSPQAAVQKTLLVLHSLKGSAQAVGFLGFAALMHEAEEVLGTMEFGPDSEHLFSQLIDGIENYFHRLGETLEDLPGLATGCQQQLAAIAKAGEGEPSEPSPQAPQAAWGLFEDAPTPAAVLATAKIEPVSPAALVDKKVTAEAGKYLLLEQSGRLFAVRLDEVKEIVSNHFLNPLPHPQKGLKGLIVVRNRALPVLDLGMASESQSDESRICAVICESDEQSFAVRVQKPRQVIALEAQDFENVLDRSLSQTEQHQLIRHVAKFNGQSVLIVDFKSMLTS